MIKPGRWIKAAALSAVLIAAGAGGAALAQGSSATPQVAAAAAAPVDSAVETLYTPIPSCRIVDTRNGGGAIAANGSRFISVLGSGNFARQGGKSCGIPTDATAVTASVVVVGARTGGYVDVYPFGAADQKVSFLNFTANETVSASGTLLVANPNGVYNLIARIVGGPTNLLVQISGYYIRPMWASIDTNGRTVYGSRLVSSTRTSEGNYTLVFDRDISRCAFSATSNYYGTTIYAQPSSSNTHAAFVSARNAGAVVDAAFYLRVSC